MKDNILPQFLIKTLDRVYFVSDLSPHYIFFQIECPSRRTTEKQYKIDLQYEPVWVVSALRIHVQIMLCS